MKNTKALPLTLLCASLIAGALMACSEQTDDVSAADTSGAEETTAAAAESVTENDQPYSSLLKYVDYGGAEFNIYTSNTVNGMNMSILQNYAEKETGEVINDALFARDRFLEENYNVNVNYTCDDTNSTGQIAQKLAQSILAGDDAYQLVILDHATATKSLASQGAIYPLNYIDTIHLDADYWMPELNKNTYIGTSMYYPSCMISPRYFGSVYVIMFNQDMARELDLGDMYALVHEGKWTFDKMMEFARLAVKDLDGDGDIEGDDRIGLMFESHEGFLLASGYSLVENKNNSLACGLEHPEMISFIQHALDCFTEQGVFNDGWNVDGESVYANGTALFTNPCTFSLDAYRDLNYDYGILPMPKYTEEQERYIGFSQPWINAAPAIPITATGEKLDMIGTLTDAMVAYGYDYIKPAVYDNVLRMKGARDEQSALIMDEIFSNITIELSCTLNLASYRPINEVFTSKLGTSEITSAYAGAKKAIESELAGIMKSYEEFAARLD